MHPLAARTARRLHVLDREGLDHAALRAELGAWLGTRLGADAVVTSTVDPATVLATSCVLWGMSEDPARELAIHRQEYGDQPDLNRFRALFSSQRRAGALRADSGGDIQRSRRARELLQPLGVSDELRLLALDRGQPWGAVVLYRGSGAFDPDAVEGAAALSEVIGGTLRRALLRAAIGRSTADEHAPGLLWVEADGRVHAAGDAGEAMLQLGGPSLVGAARVVAAAGEGTRVVEADGLVLQVHPMPIDGRAAVLVEEARPVALADIIVRAWGLTPREREVVMGVARGRSSKELSTDLGISEWTVQDHLKSIFDKAGLHTRGELVAALFFRHCLPERERGATPSPRGWFLPSAAEGVDARESENRGRDP